MTGICPSCGSRCAIWRTTLTEDGAVLGESMYWLCRCGSHGSRAVNTIDVSGTVFDTGS